MSSKMQKKYQDVILKITSAKQVYLPNFTSNPLMSTLFADLPEDLINTAHIFQSFEIT